MSNLSPVPTIDCSPGTGFTAEALAELDLACRESGFFYLRNHGLESLIDRVWQQTRWFFALGLDAKQSVARSEKNSRGFYDRELTKNIRDMKEVFDFGPCADSSLPCDDAANHTQDGWNQWPDVAGGEEFRMVMSDYYEACQNVGITLLQQITKNLEESPDHLMQDFLPSNSSFVRLNYYPLLDPLGGDAGLQRADATGHMGVHQHTDAGALTLLLQDSVGGLQIHHNGRWIDIPPVPDTLVVNIGDIVQVWSNDQYKAALHRVVASSREDRYSLPFFLNPKYQAYYAPLSTQVSPTQPSLYRPINWGEFRYQHQNGDYGDFGQEIQISDFRVESKHSQAGDRS